MSNSDQIVQYDQTRCEERYTQLTTCPALAKIIMVMQTLMRDLFAVAKDLVEGSEDGFSILYNAIQMLHVSCTSVFICAS